MIPGQVLQEIREAFERCQSRYPTIDLPFEVFLSRVEAAVDVSPSGEQSSAGDDCHPWLVAFSRLHHEDLFLALACAAGNRIAWEYFADDYLTLVLRFAQRACKNLQRGEDLAQDLVAELLGESAREILDRPSMDADGAEQDTSGAYPQKGRLAGYNGIGSLASWLRVVVSRAAIDRFRKRRPQKSLEELREEGIEAAVASPLNEEGPDSRWGSIFSEVLSEEIQNLPDRDRLLLSLYYLEGVPLRSIGTQFQVHEATASRWLEGLRRTLRKRVERVLRTRHKLKARDIQGLWHWVSRQETLSLKRVLRHSGGAAGEKKVQDETI